MAGLGPAPHRPPPPAPPPLPKTEPRPAPRPSLRAPPSAPTTSDLTPSDPNRPHPTHSGPAWPQAACRHAPAGGREGEGPGPGSRQPPGCLGGGQLPAAGGRRALRLRRRAARRRRPGTQAGPSRDGGRGPGNKPPLGKSVVWFIVLICPVADLRMLV